LIVGAVGKLMNAQSVFIGYLVAAVLMIGAAIAELILGVKAERRSLEEVAAPLSESR
jgi:hypothetical protein